MDEKKVRNILYDLVKILEIAEEIETETLDFKNIPVENLEVVIEALEKQLPKKVNYEGAFINNGFTRYRMAKCPTCERWYSSNDENNYCSGCGQKLDWSEEDE